MSLHKPVLNTSSDGSIYAFIVRVDVDGEHQVIRGYKGRHFKSEKAALKSTNSYIEKYCS